MVDVGDVAVEPELADRHRPAAGPRRARTGPRRDGGRRSILGTSPCVRTRRWPTISCASICPLSSSTLHQIGGRGGARWIAHAEPLEQRRVGGARLGDAQFRQPGQQFAQLVLLHRVVAAVGEAPDSPSRAMTSVLPLLVISTRAACGELVGEPGKHQRAGRHRAVSLTLAGARPKYQPPASTTTASAARMAAVRTCSFLPVMPAPAPAGASRQAQHDARAPSEQPAPARCRPAAARSPAARCRAASRAAPSRSLPRVADHVAAQILDRLRAAVRGDHGLRWRAGFAAAGAQLRCSCFWTSSRCACRACCGLAEARLRLVCMLSTRLNGRCGCRGCAGRSARRRRRACRSGWRRTARCR